MLSLGHLTVRERELLRISGQDGQLNITVAWPLTDLPLLVAMPEQLSLRFHHLADDGASIQAALAGWDVEPGPDAAGMTVRLRLVLVDEARESGDRQVLRANHYRPTASPATHSITSPDSIP